MGTVVPVPGDPVDYAAIRAVVADVVNAAVVPVPEPVDMTDYARVEQIVAGIQIPVPDVTVQPVVTEKVVEVPVPGQSTVEYVDREVQVEVPVEVPKPRVLWKDIVERVIRTFLVTFVTVFAAGFTPEIDMDGAKALAIAGATAGGTALLGLITQYIGPRDTASVVD